MKLQELIQRALTYKDSFEYLGFEPIGEGGTIMVPKGHELLEHRGLSILIRECTKNFYKVTFSPFGSKVVIYFRKTV